MSSASFSNRIECLPSFAMVIPHRLSSLVIINAHPLQLASSAKFEWPCWICHHSSSFSPVMTTGELDFGAWLKREIEDIPMEQPAFAAASGIPFRTLRHWIQSPKPNIRGANMTRLAKGLGRPKEVIEQMLAASRGWTVTQPAEVVSLHSIPLYAGVSAARWDERDDPDQPDGRSERTVDAPVRDPAAFAVVVDGACMEPDYPDGWVAVFSPLEVEQNGIVDGEDYYVQLDGSGDGRSTFKRVTVDPSSPTHLLLTCLNPAFTATLRVSRESVIRAAMAVSCIRLNSSRKRKARG